MDKNDVNTQVFVRILAKKPGWKEANFQVNKIQTDCLQLQ